MNAPLLSEDEVRRRFFTKESRPTRQAFARIRREHGLPHIRLGRKILYVENEVSSHLEKFRRLR